MPLSHDVNPWARRLPSQGPAASGCRLGCLRQATAQTACSAFTCMTHHKGCSSRQCCSGLSLKSTCCTGHCRPDKCATMEHSKANPSKDAAPDTCSDSHSGCWNPHCADRTARTHTPKNPCSDRLHRIVRNPWHLLYAPFCTLGK